MRCPSRPCPYVWRTTVSWGRLRHARAVLVELHLSPTDRLLRTRHLLVHQRLYRRGYPVFSTYPLVVEPSSSSTSHHSPLWGRLLDCPDLTQEGMVRLLRSHGVSTMSASGEDTLEETAQAVFAAAGSDLEEFLASPEVLTYLPSAAVLVFNTTTMRLLRSLQVTPPQRAVGEPLLVSLPGLLLNELALVLDDVEYVPMPSPEVLEVLVTLLRDDPSQTLAALLPVAEALQARPGTALLV